jgi:D-3-phosphoglycerate dehydrogenase
MLKVLIADKLSETAVKDLEDMGCTVDFSPTLKAEDLPGRLKNIDVLVVRSTKVSAEAIKNAPQLSLIVRAGAGVNTIDCATASAYGIYVANCPGKNSDAVAELTLGLLIAADRDIANASADLRAGLWGKKKYGKAQGLKGRTLGVIGLGMIGRAVVKRAQGLKMNILAWSRSLTPERAQALGVEYAASPLDVAKGADALTLHIAVSPQTRHLVNQQFLKNMKPGAILINASRGEIIDTTALKEAIKSRDLRVGLDVFENEPSAGDNVFADLELAGLVRAATPHIGASTVQASEAIAAETVRIIRIFKQTGKAPNTVNLSMDTPVLYHLVVRHFNRVGVLAGILNGLRNDGINVGEMGNTIFADAKAACATLHLDGEPSATTLSAIRQNPDVIQAVLEKCQPNQ